MRRLPAIYIAGYCSGCQNIHWWIDYDWPKRTKFLLTVIYGSLQQHSYSSKTFKKNRNKLKYIFITILGLAESFKTMNRPDSKRSLTVYFSESIQDSEIKFWHNFYSSLQFVLFKFGILIFDNLETIRFSAA